MPDDPPRPRGRAHPHPRLRAAGQERPGRAPPGRRPHRPQARSRWDPRRRSTAEAPVLPELFVSLAAVGERTGRMPRGVRRAEEYYRLQGQMKREFRSPGRLAGVPVHRGRPGHRVRHLHLRFPAAERRDRQRPGRLRAGRGARGRSCSWSSSARRRRGDPAYKLLTSLGGQDGRLRGLAAADAGRRPVRPRQRLSRFCLALRLTLDSSLSITKAIPAEPEGDGQRGVHGETTGSSSDSRRATRDAALGSPRSSRPNPGQLNVGEEAADPGGDGPAGRVLPGGNGPAGEDSDQAMAWGVYGPVGVRSSWRFS